MSKGLAAGLPNMDKPVRGFIRFVYKALRMTALVYSIENDR